MKPFLFTDGSPQALLPTDQEVDRSLSIMERFMGIIGEFEDKRRSGDPQPGRT